MPGTSGWDNSSAVPGHPGERRRGGEGGGQEGIVNIMSHEQTPRQRRQTLNNGESWTRPSHTLLPLDQGEANGSAS